LITADSVEAARTRPPRKTKAETPADRIARRVAYERAVRPNWSEPGQSAFNLRHEIMDLRSRPELLDAPEHRFLSWLQRYAIIRNPETRVEEVWLSFLQVKRLNGLTRRFVNPGEEIAFKKRQQEAALS
jgi:hypothetical protein